MSNDRSVDTQNRWGLEDRPVPVRMKLSALWATVMFLYVYVDILGFFKPGTIDDILMGRVWVLDITQAWAFGALALMTIPILMVFLSLVLRAPVARWTNVVVGFLYIPVSIFNVVDGTWPAFKGFGAAVETALLVLVVWYAWSWPRVAEVRTRAAEARATTSPV
jgi:hypothetical protein